MRPECRPVQQKLRRVKPEMLLKIKEEVKKQLDVGFLKVAKYLEWVVNIVSVLKKNGKVRMFVDYIDLNWASPKDKFPLPHMTHWWITQQRTLDFHSWMVSLDIIKFGWLWKTGRKLLLLPCREPFATKLCLSV